MVAYLALLVALAATLVSGRPSQTDFALVLVLLALLGLLDKTVFLAARAEHYATTLLVFVVMGEAWIGGAKAVQAALWFWAGVSKLNHHFPAVVCVMTSNSPFARAAWIRRRMYRNFPRDVRPSRLAVWMAHGETLLELAVPIVLLAGDGGAITTAGLVLMVLLHGFITSTVPMGVPLEWNVMVVYGAFVLFGVHADAPLFAGMPEWLVLVLVMVLAGVPLLGNLVPARVSFLPAMRYYAGNWACGVWLFRGEEAIAKLRRLTTSAPWLYDQLDRFYDRETSIGLVGKVIAFRLMHLHGRAFGVALPAAVEGIEDYEWLDGELVAGLALGWNFGDGHLHHEPLLRSLQDQCEWEPGEVRCVFVESQPLLESRLHWRAHDAATGLLAEGNVDVAELRARQPWDWM